MVASKVATRAKRHCNNVNQGLIRLTLLEERGEPATKSGAAYTEWEPKDQSAECNCAPNT